MDFDYFLLLYLFHYLHFFYFFFFFISFSFFFAFFFILYRSLFLINYNSEDNHSCEYFYYNHKSLAELPIFTIKIGKSFYILKNYDTFNSQTRKRFIVINSPKNKYIDVYNTQYTKLNIEKNIKKEKEQKTMTINKNKESNSQLSKRKSFMKDSGFKKI